MAASAPAIHHEHVPAKAGRKRQECPKGKHFNFPPDSQNLIIWPLLAAEVAGKCIFIWAALCPAETFFTRQETEVRI